jgi:hypothetical protein
MNWRSIILIFSISIATRAQVDPGDIVQFELFQFKQSIVQKVMHPDRF